MCIRDRRYDDLRKELNISEEDVQSLSYLHGADVERGTILNDAILKEYDGYMPVSYTHLDVYKRQPILPGQ